MTAEELAHIKKRIPKNLPRWGYMVEPNIYYLKGDRFRVQIRRGSSDSEFKLPPWRSPIESWETADLRQLAILRDEQQLLIDREQAKLPVGAKGKPQPATLAADVQRHLKKADITEECRKGRTVELAWWCAQPAAEGADVIKPQQFYKERDAGLSVDRGKTLGALPRRLVTTARIREILLKAFAPTDRLNHPTEFANTSNSYRTALNFLYNELDQDDPNPMPNPVSRIKIRPTKKGGSRGQDMRVVHEILTLGRSPKAHRAGANSYLRLAVLAWVHITPKQLKQFDPRTDFHDVPEEERGHPTGPFTYSRDREHCLAGRIWLMKQPRMKGRKGKPIPPPEPIAVNPRGAAAMRAYIASSCWSPTVPLRTSKEWQGAKKKFPGVYNSPGLNTRFREMCVRVQPLLDARKVLVDGVPVDLSPMTVYKLKHSLTTAARTAAAKAGLGNLMDDEGNIVVDEGTQRVNGHTNAAIARVYSDGAVPEILITFNRLTTLHLETLFTHPLDPKPDHLRIVKTINE